MSKNSPSMQSIKSRLKNIAKTINKLEASISTKSEDKLAEVNKKLQAILNSIKKLEKETNPTPDDSDYFGGLGSLFGGN